MDQTESKRDTFMLTTFLEACMKLLRDTKVVKGLQELITRCAGADEPRLVESWANMHCERGMKCG